MGASRNVVLGAAVVLVGVIPSQGSPSRLIRNDAGNVICVLSAESFLKPGQLSVHILRPKGVLSPAKISVFLIPAAVRSDGRPARLLPIATADSYIVTRGSPDKSQFVRAVFSLAAIKGPLEGVAEATSKSAGQRPARTMCSISEADLSFFR